MGIPEETPSEVLWLMAMGCAKHPISVTQYEEIVKRNPTYFPKEYDRIVKWESIPKEVHEAHDKELSEFMTNVWKDEPKSPGIMGIIDNTDAAKEYNKAHDRIWPLIEAKSKELSKKYYDKYLK